MQALKHFLTVTKHRNLVIKYCFKVGLGSQGLRHDLSKYSPTEFLTSVKHYQGYRSPNEGERAEYGYSLAWMHHKGRNKHHFEYWTDYDPKTKQLSPVKMPLKYTVEMFCDRVSASRTYQREKYTDDLPLRYFQRGLTARKMHPETAAFLEKLLTMLAEKGENATFAYIKQYLKTHKDY